MSAVIDRSVLEQIAQQAQAADAERSVAPEVIAALRASGVMRMTASASLGGSGSSMLAVALELRAVAAACSSTAWCLWNHLCTFHLFCGLLGPANETLLRRIVAQREWVCFPAGASTATTGERQGDTFVLTGKGAFGSGSRYAQWAGASFVSRDHDGPLFTLVDLRSDGVRIDPTWYALSLRASATDDVHYESAHTPAAHVVPFPMMYRVHFRDPEVAMIDARYREDWVGLSDLWLGAMASALCAAALEDIATRHSRTRRDHGCEGGAASPGAGQPRACAWADHCRLGYGSSGIAGDGRACGARSHANRGRLPGPDVRKHAGAATVR